jgi:hypothetical protein
MDIGKGSALDGVGSMETVDMTMDREDARHLALLCKNKQKLHASPGLNLYKTSHFLRY